MRKTFFIELHKRMQEDERIFFITADLGFGLADDIRKDFPERFINVGAAEQCMMGVGVGLAMSGKIPFVYSITPFLLWRAAETIRNYVNHESVPVKMIGSGRDDNYKHDGFSHFAGDDNELMKCFGNMVAWWPEDEKSLLWAMNKMLTIQVNQPWYLNLKR